MSTVIHRNLCVQSVTRSKIEPCTARDQRARQKERNKTEQPNTPSLASLVAFLCFRLLACARSRVPTTNTTQGGGAHALVSIILPFFVIPSLPPPTSPPPKIKHNTNHPRVRRPSSDSCARKPSAFSSSVQPYSTAPGAAPWAAGCWRTPAGSGAPRRVAAAADDEDKHPPPRKGARPLTVLRSTPLTLGSR